MATQINDPNGVNTVLPGGNGNLTGGADPVTGAPTAAPTLSFPEQGSDPSAPGYNSSSTNRYNNPATPVPTATGVTGTTYNNDVSAAAQTPEQIQSGIAALYAQEIAGIQAQYNSLINQQTNTNANNTGSVRASAAASGALGSAAGNSDISAETDIGNKSIGNLSAEEQAALGAVTDKEATAALGIYNTNQSNLQTEAGTYATQLSADAANALKSLPTLAASGADFSTIDATTLANLSQATGMSTSQLQSLYNAYQVAATKPGDQVIQSGDGTYWMVQTDPITGAVIGSQNLGLPASPISVGANSSIFQPGTNGAPGAIVANGQQTPTVVPITSSTTGNMPATAPGAPATPGTTPPAASGAPGTAPVAPSSPQGASSGAGAGTAPSSAPTAAEAQTSGFTNGLAQGGTPTWNSLASLPGVTSSQLGLLKTLYSSPQLAYAQGMNWIINGASMSASGSSASGGRSGASAAVGDPAQAIGAGILQSYGLTEQDANAIQQIDTGLSSSLTTAIESQQGTKQYMNKIAQQAGILSSAVSQYGDNSGSPLWNVAQQAFQSNVVSDPNLQSVKIALQGFLQDYSRIVTNSTGSGATPTDAANATAQDKLNTLMSQGTLSAAITTMIQEMNAVQGSWNNQVSSLTESVSNVVQNYAASKNQAAGASGMGNSASTTATASPTGQISVNTPQGNFYFPTQAAANAFKQAAGL